MLARESGRQKRIEQYEAELDEWATSMHARWTELRQWYERRKEFWALEFLKQAVPRLTVKFVEDWLRLVFEGGNLAAIGEDGAARALIRDRDDTLKSARASWKTPGPWRHGAVHRELPAQLRWKEVKKIIINMAGPERGSSMLSPKPAISI